MAFAPFRRVGIAFSASASFLSSASPALLSPGISYYPQTMLQNFDISPNRAVTRVSAFCFEKKPDISGKIRQKKEQSGSRMLLPVF